jgi:para-nitrobenzyl esterase
MAANRVAGLKDHRIASARLHPAGEARHGDDPQLPFSNDRMDAMAGSDPDRQRVADNRSQLWASFARTGQPKAKGQPEWPAYTTQTRATIEIDAECRIVNDPFGQERIMLGHLDSN